MRDLAVFEFICYMAISVCFLFVIVLTVIQIRWERRFKRKHNLK